jgi:3-phosphoshikimate 1-carboxyvinyltransferase
MITLQAPPSKSVSHRTVIAASLAPGPSLVRGVLDSADLERTRSLLCLAGAHMQDLGGGTWRIRGMEGGPRGGGDAPLLCDAGESGTTCRLLTAVLSAGQGQFIIDGAKRMRERPIGPLAKALTSLGASITYGQEEEFPPLQIHAHGLAGGDVEISIDSSSQYLSGLLLAAPFCSAPLRITLAGNKAVSWPYVGLTLNVLEDFGIRFAVEQPGGDAWRCVPWRSIRHARPGELRITVSPGTYRAGEYGVEGDWSGASYLLAAGAVGKSPVLVKGLRTDSLQGDRAMLRILQGMGASVRETAEGILVSPSALHGIDTDMGDCPDLVPTVAMLAACASGTTRIRNVAHLRIKECDRLSACAGELARAGIRTEETESSIVIRGAGPQRPSLPAGTVFLVHNDHRIAMSAALLCLACGTPARVDDPGVVRKSFPGFWDTWSMLP